MSPRAKLTCIIINCIFFLTFAFPHPFFLEPQAVAGSEGQYKPSHDEEVFAAAVNSFALLSTLLQDVSYQSDSIYPIVNRADDIKDAIHYLSLGFSTDLAEAIANYYLGWDEELARLVVIPTDSIPLLTMADKKETSVVFINDHHAVLQHIYRKCYAEQDSYNYTIHMQKDVSGWKIYELTMEEIR